MDHILYVAPCVVCGENTGFPTPDTYGACGPCTPHICTPELPEDNWCDFCGKDI